MADPCRSWLYDRAVGTVEQAGQAEAPPSGDARGATYLPYLDGLRAVAVYLVVAFHAGIGRLSGGFIGVDIFFVLSGYLVTALLLRDIASHGSIRFWRFYSRRFRRLLPAAAVALLITAVVYAGVASPSAVDLVRAGFVACFLYVANWFFIHESTNYFAAGADPSPVLHFWSLAVEEQFYLAWPVLLGTLLWAARRFAAGRRLVVPVVVAVAALASVARAFVLKGDQPDRAYFGTDTRAYQLLAGALIALAPGVIRRAARLGRAAPAVAIAAVGGLVIVGSRIVDVDPIERGVIATVLTVALVIVLGSSSNGLVHRALSLEPVVYLGRISYGTYLWHFPVIIVAGQLADPGPKALLAIAVLTATALASLSYQLLEHPIRHSTLLDRHQRVVVIVGLAISLIGGLVLMPRILDPPSSSTATAVASTESGFHAVPIDIDLGAVHKQAFGRAPDCTGSDLAPCTVVKGTGRHLLLMGDSNAEMIIPAFTKMAREQNLTLSLAIRAGCPWQENVYQLGPAVTAACKRSKADWYRRVLPTGGADLVVVMNVDLLLDSDGRTFIGTPRNRTIRDNTTGSLRLLRGDGRDVVILESIPHAAAEVNPLDCLARSDVIEKCRFVASPGPSWLDEQGRAAAEADPHLWSLDIDALACPFLPICDPIVGGRVTYWNNAHLTVGYATTLGSPLAQQFQILGLIPR